MSAVYSASLILPDSQHAAQIAYDGLDQALIMAERLQGVTAEDLRVRARAAFDGTFVVVIGIATAVIIRARNGRDSSVAPEMSDGR